jgi:hypothetical protein
VEPLAPKPHHPEKNNPLLYSDPVPSTTWKSAFIFKYYSEGKIILYEGD